MERDQDGRPKASQGYPRGRASRPSWPMRTGGGRARQFTEVSGRLDSVAIAGMARSNAVRSATVLVAAFGVLSIGTASGAILHPYLAASASPYPLPKAAITVSISLPEYLTTCIR